jgi:hypothetical protein
MPRPQRRRHGRKYAYFPPIGAEFTGKAIDNGRMQSPAAAGNFDGCIEHRLQLLAPRGLALLARIGIARFPDLFGENLRGSRISAGVDRGGRTLEARRSHD